MNKYYKYKGLHFLNDTFNKNTKLYDNIHICAYDVNSDGKYPFQRFLLINTEEDKMLKFPTVTINKLKKHFSNSNSNTYIDEFINFVKVSLFGLFQLYIDDFAEFNSGLSFNGFYEYENNLYLFFDVTNCNIKINDVYRANTLWFVTIEEIMNIKYCCHMPIAEIVTDFFIQNNGFCFLLDQNNNYYEIPMVGYVGKPENELQFTFILGKKRDYNNGMFGPYYYFTNFYSAFKEGLISKTYNIPNGIIDLSLIDEYGYYINGGIIRFAIFTGVTKYIENNILDTIDNSAIKQQRLQDKHLDQNFERLTMRISDCDGKWAESYDSIILGKIELDNGTYIPDINIVVKESSQQIPLSYHYIDKDSLNGQIENGQITDYLII